MKKHSCQLSTVNYQLNDEYISIAALNQYAYCPHRFWRMHCAGEFTDNQYTIEGTSLHDRVHTFGAENREETWQIRAIWLKSEQYKLIGKSDLIELENGQWFPVEYKRGKKGEWDNDELQICAQALCLEEMTGQNISIGYVYYAQTHQRKLIEITSELRRQTIIAINNVMRLLATGVMPQAIYTNRCRGCSLYEQCLPKAPEKIRKYCEE